MSDEHDPSFIKIGSAGNVNGVSTWDEKGHTQIVQIFISHGYGVIQSIQFQYAENRTLVLSARHGSNNLVVPNFDVVKLNHPSEYITWISVETGSLRPGNYLKCITIGTNCRTYGPFGQSSENADKSIIRLGQNQQFGGFHGTADTQKVWSIGIYLKPAMNREMLIY